MGPGDGGDDTSSSSLSSSSGNGLKLIRSDVAGEFNDTFPTKLPTWAEAPFGETVVTRGAKGFKGPLFASIEVLLETIGTLAVGRFASALAPNISDPEILLDPLDDEAFTGSTRNGFVCSTHLNRIVAMTQIYDQILTIAYTVRQSDKNFTKIRIISARKASRNERKAYQK